MNVNFRRHLVPVLCTIMGIALLLQTGCTTYGVISNTPIGTTPHEHGYSLAKGVKEADHSRRLSIVLCFSGGGTRAAALSYGVLGALRDTRVVINGQSRRLLDEVDVISSVSGGSFTAAYYGLYGDRIFDDFERKFLRRDLDSELFHAMFHPKLWFTRKGRTEMAVRHFEETLFQGATFADLQSAGAPMIIINASDLGRGVRFSFLQDYFDLLCSDLSTFPVARAVTASSAVPILFNPVILENHPGCESDSAFYLELMAELVEDSPYLSQVMAGLSSYADKGNRRFVHLVDGGITDNLGLMAFYEIIEVSGGIRQFIDVMDGYVAPHFLLVTVNASTNPRYSIESSKRVPSLEESISALTDVQLHRANAVTLDLMRNSVKRWADELSTDETPLNAYFAVVDFSELNDPVRFNFLNQIPTSFTLSKTQVDELIRAGRELILINPEFLRLLANLEAEARNQ